MKSLHLTLASILLAAATASAQFGGDAANLITNGKFENADANGFPQDWTVSHPNFLKKCETQVELITEGDTTFYRVTKNAATGPGIGWQEIEIPEGAGSLRIAAKMRGKGIVRGEDNWHFPGVGVTYLFEGSEEGKAGDVGKWLKVPAGDSEWQEYEAIIPVKDGARKANISLIGANWTGTADFTDIVVEIVE